MLNRVPNYEYSHIFIKKTKINLDIKIILPTFVLTK